MSHTLPQTNTISNAKFLEGVMGPYWPAAYVTGFAEDPAQLDTLGLRHYWGGGIYQNVAPEYPEHNNFFVISTFYPDPEDGKTKRRKANFAAAYCVMVDDIGTGIGAKISDLDMLAYPEPSWKLETSPGNYQYGYVFKDPITDATLVNALLDGLVDLGLVEDGTDPGMKGVTRYARLPNGSNTKAKYGGGFRCRLTHWKPELKYTPHQLAHAFHINLKDYYREEQINAPIPENQDIVYQSLKRLGLVKGKLREGIHDVVCPWLSDHSDRADSGAAYLSPMGFKCHHGHCATRTGRDLLNWLHGADPEYAKASEVAIPFQPVTEKVAPEQLSEATNQEKPFADRMQEALGVINPNDPDSLLQAFVTLSMEHNNLTAVEREHWINLIRKESQFSIKSIREQLKRTREELLRQNRQGRGILNEPAWKEFDGDKPLAHFSNFEALCNFHGIIIRYNLMAHTVDVSIPDTDFGDEEVDNLNLIYMRDLVNKHGMGRAEVGDWMLRLAQENSYHPFVDYLDDLPSKVNYDPMSPNFEKLLGTLSIDEDEAESIIFIRRWLISIVAAVRGHHGSGLKGVLVFSGPQSIGKTSWFRNLLPHDDMFMEGLTLDAHNKDSMINATNHLVAELGELDSTFRKDIAALKSFLTNQTDKIRHPYAAKTSKQKRRTVFCGTVNDAHFLVDLTGNSRFWPVSVSSCDFLVLRDMWKNGEMDGLWYEVDMWYQAYCSGRNEFRWYMNAAETVQFDKVREEYIQQSPGEQLLRQHFDVDGPLVQFMETDAILETMGIRPRDQYYHARQREVFSTLSRLLNSKRVRRQVDGRRVRGYMMPRTVIASLAPVNLPFAPTLSVVNSDDYDFL